MSEETQLPLDMQKERVEAIAFHLDGSVREMTCSKFNVGEVKFVIPGLKRTDAVFEHILAEMLESLVGGEWYVLVEDGMATANRML